MTTPLISCSRCGEAIPADAEVHVGRHRVVSCAACAMARYARWPAWATTRITCSTCGRAVVVYDRRMARRYCSAACSAVAEAARVARLNAAVSARRAEARAARKATCAGCGSTFTPTRADARYCSGACRVAAHRARRDPRARPPG